MMNGENAVILFVARYGSWDSKKETSTDSYCENNI